MFSLFCLRLYATCRNLATIEKFRITDMHFIFFYLGAIFEVPFVPPEIPREISHPMLDLSAHMGSSRNLDSSNRLQRAASSRRMNGMDNSSRLQRAGESKRLIGMDGSSRLQRTGESKRSIVMDGSSRLQRTGESKRFNTMDGSMRSEREIGSKPNNITIHSPVGKRPLTRAAGKRQVVQNGKIGLGAKTTSKRFT